MSVPFDVLFFEVRGRRCALPVAVVREVMATPPVTPIPGAPPALRGVVPVHGQVLPLLDIGPQLVAAGPAEAPPPRWEADRMVLVETTLPAPAAAGETAPGEGGNNRQPVRAAFVAGRVTRLGSVDPGHSRPPPTGPGFISATVLDVEGPALLLDAGAALLALRQQLSPVGTAP
jgi:chemotaxis signal transduction protein